ncbi:MULTISPECIES: tetratricopeptide repeat protein [unclassified Microcoleus]|uniref:tetratricopeptide repeat protein n=1 Tax=unclassified Microcoleus TaxID=2642155 RepID=UPI002FD70483
MLYSPFKRLNSTHCRLTHVFLGSISLFLLATIPLLTTPDSLFPAIAQTTDAREAEADRLLQQGIQQLQTGQLRAALNSWQQALQIYRALKNRRGEGNALVNVGVAYLNLGDSAKAIEYSQQYLGLAREIKNRQVEGMALGNLGLAYYYLGNYPKVIEYSQQQLAIAREIQQIPCKCGTLHSVHQQKK